MRYKKTIKNIAFLLIGIVVITGLTKMSSRTKNSILKDGYLAIGHIDKYSKKGGYGTSPGFYYHYSSSNKTFDYFSEDGANYTISSWKLPSLEKRKMIKKGDKFLVIYGKSGSILLYDYKIRDSTDFKRHIKTIQSKRNSTTNDNQLIEAILH